MLETEKIRFGIFWSKSDMASSKITVPINNEFNLNFTQTAKLKKLIQWLS